MHLARIAAAAGTLRRRAIPAAGAIAVVAALGTATAAPASAYPLTPLVTTTTTTTVDDAATDNPKASLRYVGTWGVGSSTSAYKNTHYSSTAGARVEITFRGTEMSLFGPGGNFGQANISTDGGAVKFTDPYRNTPQTRMRLYSTGTLPYGEHKVVVTVAGTRNTLSTSNVWALDDVVVTNPAIKTNYGGLYGTTEADRLRRGVNQQWVKVKWSDLEPTEGVYNWAPVTDLLAANPDLVVRLHVNGGQYAPEWLKTAAGKVTVTNTKDGITATVGQYWTPRYTAAYNRFVAALGAQFDGNARVASVNMFGTSLIYDEPWITGGAASGAALYSAGLTKDKVIASQNAGLAATVAAFPRTIVEMPLHGQFTYPVAGGQKGTWADGIGLLNSWDAQYGGSVIFTDYGFGAGDYTDAATSLTTAPNLYSWMHLRSDLGRPIAFQATMVPGTAGGSTAPTPEVANATNAEAVRMGARWFEHHSWSYLTVEEAAVYDAGYKANVK